MRLLSPIAVTNCQTLGVKIGAITPARVKTVQIHHPRSLRLPSAANPSLGRKSYTEECKPDAEYGNDHSDKWDFKDNVLAIECLSIDQLCDRETHV